MNIVIGGAWPYANGSLHIGHIGGLLPGDILARYFRQKGCRVQYVSGSDCHGTPITLRARKEQKTPEEIANYYHDEFCQCFTELGFSYDYYGKSSSDDHKNFVKKFHEALYKSPSIVEKTNEQAYCEICNQFLPDRFVNGFCPNCGKDARGDQCEHCNAVFDSVELKNPTCAQCGNLIQLRPSTNLYLKLSDYEETISQLIHTKAWRKNAVDFTKRYIGEGLHDRALTRDLDWGIDVPKAGYENKKIYIWAENVLGYLSSCYVSCLEKGENFNDYWRNEGAFHYYIHGKDNIPFHSIILPALLLAEGSGYNLPNAIISSEYFTLNGKKISTSKDYAVWIHDLLDNYNPDSIRYFLTINGPEKRDADFSYGEFINSNNGELLGVYGNFVNRSLVFITKYYDGLVPNGLLDKNIGDKINSLYQEVGLLIEEGNFKDGLSILFDFARFSNKYFDSQKPWETRTTDPHSCANTLFNCVQIIGNLSVLLEPFIPFSSEKIYDWLKLENTWSVKTVDVNLKIPETEILFKRIDKTEIGLSNK